jgi:hypothetical protein
MKKIIYTILLIILNTGFVFAQNNLSINLDKEKIFLDESFSLNIKLITDQNIKNDLTID